MTIDTAHRPWPLPGRRWNVAMTWHDLLFAHWPVPVETVRSLVPMPLEIDTFDGSAWVGVVPFCMTGVRPRYVPAMRRMSDFPEINVRTYVRTPDRAGVWFFSLDAAHRAAVRTARWRFHLPYHDARIMVAKRGQRVSYHSVRTHRGAPPAEFKGSYGPSGSVYHAAPGTLEHWLTERYCLFAADRTRRIGVGEIHHAPWPLQPATAELEVNTMAAPLGLVLPADPPLLHFAQRLDVTAWTLNPAIV